MNYGSAQQRGLYYRMPFALKNLFATWYGSRQRRLRYGEYFRLYLNELESSQNWDSARLEAVQKEKVREFLETAVSGVPYYREQSEYGRALANGDLSGLPLLSKETVRANLHKLYNRHYTRLGVRWAHTSGTTGKSLCFPVTLECFQREYAFRALHFSWSKSTVPGDRVAFCQGHPVAHYDRQQPPFWVYDRANDFLMLSSYHLSPSNLQAYATELDRFQPGVICGYPSSVYLLAQGYRLYGNGRVKPKAVYTTSETLLEFQRTAIRKAFGCAVLDWYGNSEMCANIVECEFGERHMKPEHSFVEVLDSEGRVVPPGGTGRMVCTGFGNCAFPLIRYDIGDVATLAATQKSKCGRSGVLVESVLGRVEDYVVSADGRLVGRLDHIFKDAVNVLEAQIVQREPRSVILRVVRTGSYTRADERALREETVLRLGSDTAIRFEYVTGIPRTSNGKVRFIESSLDKTRLLAFTDGLR